MLLYEHCNLEINPLRVKILEIVCFLLNLIQKKYVKGIPE
jgi:hypothetical protein